MPTSQLVASCASQHHQHQFIHSRPRSPIAPLASLDCSITEPISSNQLATNANSNHSSTDTPTLSGYFECDQLSDAVDDSLFEITNTGCLSRSIFSTHLKAELAAAQVVGGGVQVEAQVEQVEEQRNDIVAGRPASRDTSQVAMLSNYQAYDYSCTSSIPAHTKASTSGNSSSSHKTRSARAGQLKVSSGSQPKVNNNSSSRKARSQPDVRDDNGNTTNRDYPSNHHQGNQESASSSKKKTTSNIAATTSSKKRFTFSLFNLFSSTLR